jgi:hypothetical protein
MLPQSLTTLVPQTSPQASQLATARQTLARAKEKARTTRARARPTRTTTLQSSSRKPRQPSKLADSRSNRVAFLRASDSATSLDFSVLHLRTLERQRTPETSELELPSQTLERRRTLEMFSEPALPPRTLARQRTLPLLPKTRPLKAWHARRGLLSALKRKL